MTVRDDIQQLIRNKIFLVVLAIKVISGTLLASHALSAQHIPFIKYFVASGGSNPWQHFYVLVQNHSFPYPPMMLAFLSLPFWLTSPFASSWQTVGFLDLFLVRLPLLGADIGICLVLLQWFRGNIGKVVWLYWCSPVLFYASYYHGQFDVIPTALFLLAIHLLFKERYLLSLFMLGVGIASKGHLLLAVPFYLTYCYRQKVGTRKLLLMVAGLVIIYTATVWPVIFSDGYRHMVVKGSDLGNIFILRFPFDLMRVNLNLLLAPVAIFLLIMRFVSYEKLNRDITILFFALVFVVVIICVPPMPGWYFWPYPLLVYFILRNKEVSVFPLVVFNLLYLFYFLTYDKTAFFEAWGLLIPAAATFASPVEFVKQFGLGARVIDDLVFSLLQASVIFIAYDVFKEGIMSNELYRPKTKAIMVGIGGDSGAGKDTTVQCLEKVLGADKCIVISGDDYHKWQRGHQEWKVYTHLNAFGNKLHDQLKHAIALKDGKSVVKVTYDHDTGKFTDPEKVDPNQVIFFVGLHPFYIQRMRSLYDLKIYLEPDPDLRKYWKICRDMVDRGYTVAQVLEQMSMREGDSQKFISPQRQFADIIVNFLPQSPIDFDQIDPMRVIPLKLRLLVNNSIYLEGLMDELCELPELDVQFWHEEDLKNQGMEVSGKISSGQVGAIAERLIPNLYELLNGKPVWMDGYFGVIQLVFLQYLSEVSKLRHDTVK